METDRGRWRRVLIALFALALLGAAAAAFSLLSWRSSRSAVLNFACDGKLMAFRAADEFNPPILMVRNHDGSPATLESWALALTEDDLPPGANIVKHRNEPFGLINGESVTFLRVR